MGRFFQLCCIEADRIIRAIWSDLTYRFARFDLESAFPIWEFGFRIAD